MSEARGTPAAGSNKHAGTGPEDLDADGLTKEEASGPIAWMVKNQVAANLLMLIAIVIGCFATCSVKQEVFPEFDLDVVRVSVPYPGASPEEVEQGIVLAVEEELRGIDGVKRVTSSAAEGSGTVVAELNLGVDQDSVLADIKGAVDRIQSFPEDSEKANHQARVTQAPGDPSGDRWRPRAHYAARARRARPRAGLGQGRRHPG